MSPEEKKKYRAEYYQKNKEKAKERNREWRTKNRDKDNAMKREWAKNNPEKVVDSRNKRKYLKAEQDKKYGKEYRQREDVKERKRLKQKKRLSEKRDHINNLRRIAYRKNTDRELKRRKDYREKHPEKIKKYSKEMVKNCSEKYIKDRIERQFDIEKTDITPEMIMLKRVEIKCKRVIKNHKKEAV